ncbi:hypothetical protein NEMIN01_0900, partial [Nematocida minor]|uniref:uncharacterized protein n=1 Tax=Nematocida minor TaxID=1912983 RepID=UPI00222055E0
VLERLDALYKAANKLDSSTHRLYISLKTAESRIFPSTACTTLDTIIQKIEKDGLPKDLNGAVAELLGSMNMDRETVKMEIEKRVNRKTAQNLLPILSLVRPVNKMPEMVNIQLRDRFRPVAVMEAVQLFQWEEPVSINSDRYAQIKEHTEQIAGFRNPKGIILFFIKESQNPLIAAFAEAAETTPELLADLFPIALYASLREMPECLKMKVVDAIGEAASSLENGQRLRRIMMEGLEYVVMASCAASEAEYAMKYISPGRRNIYVQKVSPENESIQLIYFAKTEPKEFDVLIQHKNKQKQGEDRYEENINTKQVKALKDASYSVVECLRSTDDPLKTEKLLDKALDALVKWEVPYVSELFSISNSSSPNATLEAVQALDLAVSSDLDSMYTPGWMRIIKRSEAVAMKILNAKCQSPPNKKEESEHIVKTCMEYRTSIRNEIISAAMHPSSLLSFCTEAAYSPFSSILAEAVQKKDAKLARGLMMLEVPGENKILLAEKIANAATTSWAVSKKECTEIINSTLDDETIMQSKDVLDSVEKRAFTQWGRMEFTKAPLKKRIEILKELVKTQEAKEDAALFLSLLKETSPGDDTHSAILEIIEEIRPEHILENMYELFQLEETHSTYTSAIVKRLIEYSPERASFLWAVQSASPSVLSNGLSMDVSISSVAAEYVKVMQEIVQSAGDILYSKLARFKMQKKCHTKTEARPFTQEITETQKTAQPQHSHDQCLKQLLSSIESVVEQPIYRAAEKSEESVHAAIREIQEIGRIANKTPAWKTLLINRVNRVAGILAQSQPKAIYLSKRAEDILAKSYLPGTDIKVYKIEKKVEIISSLQNPRLITLIGIDGVKRQYLVKIERDSEVERTIAKIFKIMDAQVPDTYEILPNQILITAYIPNSQSLREAILEMRRDKQEENKTRSKSLERREKEEIGRLCTNYNDLRELEKMEIYLKVTDFAAKEIKWWISKHTHTVHSYLERVRTFSRTYLYNSLAAYSVGLGDRHPGNILLLADASAMHIDYVDSFDTLNTREKYRERVPLRLTPMILNSIGPEAAERMVVEGLRMFRTYEKGRNSIDAAIALLFLRRKMFRKLSKTAVQEQIHCKLVVDDEEKEINRLYKQATSLEEISQMYLGWMPFW